MSKKDYELIASVVATIVDDQTRWAVSDAFAKRLLATTKAAGKPFSVVKFMTACRTWDNLGKRITLGSN